MKHRFNGRLNRLERQTGNPWDEFHRTQVFWSAFQKWTMQLPLTPDEKAVLETALAESEAIAAAADAKLAAELAPTAARWGLTVEELATEIGLAPLWRTRLPCGLKERPPEHDGAGGTNDR